jgi:hypothetical protein
MMDSARLRVARGPFGWANVTLPVRGDAMARKTRFMQWIDQQIAEAKLDQRVEKYLKTMVVEQRRGTARAGAAPRSQSWPVARRDCRE